jgi:hypothetical protein
VPERIGVEERQRCLEGYHDGLRRDLAAIMRGWRPPDGCSWYALEDDGVGARYAPDAVRQLQSDADRHALLYRRYDNGCPCGDD